MLCTEKPDRYRICATWICLSLAGLIILYSPYIPPPTYGGGVPSNPLSSGLTTSSGFFWFIAKKPLKIPFSLFWECRQTTLALCTEHPGPLAKGPGTAGPSWTQAYQNPQNRTKTIEKPFSRPHLQPGGLTTPFSKPCLSTAEGSKIFW